MISSYIKDIKQEFSGYNLNSLKQDLMAGLTVTAVALPLALAFGVGSGASAAAGLITAIISGLLIAPLSGGSYQISGPTGAMTAILILLSQKYGLNGIWVAGLMAGIIMVAAGFLKFGKVISYIPVPVITGFTSGIAVIIAVGQIDNFFGITSEHTESSLLKLFSYFKNGINPDWPSVILGLIVIGVMVLWPKKWNKVIPSSLAGIGISLIANMFLKLPVAVIGEIPKTLLPDSRLNLMSINLSDIRDMLLPALSISALGMIESLLCGEVGGKMSGEKLDANRELISQGIGNILIPFFGGVPATAAIARTSVAIKSGGKTRLVSVFHSIGLLISMFILAPVMSQIALSALAGVLMVTAWRMNEWHNIKYIFSKKFKSAMAKFLITMTATVVFDLTQAIIIGVVFASLMFLVKISNMEIAIHEVDKARMNGSLNISLNDLLGYIRVVYFTGPIFFATVQQLSSKLKQLDDVRVLILSMRGVPLIDTSGIYALDELIHELSKKNCKLMLCALQPQVKNMLEKSSLSDKIGKDMIFWSADQAIIAAQDIVVA
ncbi:C4-dicarboxylic acid transporter DauA [Oxobacter pfennigii]|uniref:C4-dicarboxylic acid transporter DauA n=1 Tax=Oxobacter pfennigii TaxID=36849 RepID=A0A0P8YGE9_9CLOT|nr:SulP family inorganic anion transporter [Oxobacter pfennigii]KPU46105.1 C4-dicarboxylic acid transporter DauA [Oxobacter pfennigii]